MILEEHTPYRVFLFTLTHLGAHHSPSECPPCCTWDIISLELRCPWAFSAASSRRKGQYTFPRVTQALVSFFSILGKLSLVPFFQPSSLIYTPTNSQLWN